VARVLRFGRFSRGYELRERGESIRTPEMHCWFERPLLYRSHKVGTLKTKYFRLTIPYFAEYATRAGPFFELTVRSACHHFLPDRSEHQAAYNPSSEYGFVAVSVPVEGAVRELIRLTELEEIAYEK